MSPEVTPLTGFVTAVAESLVTSQNALDDAGRRSIDAFDETGVTPTVLAWNEVRFAVPLGVAVQPKDDAGEASRALITLDGGGRLAIAVRYFESEQGVDDPHPVAVAAGSPPGIARVGVGDPKGGEPA